MDNTPVDLSPFLKKGLHYRVADVLYRYFFQPIDDLLERLKARWTRQWCEENTPKR